MTKKISLGQSGVGAVELITYIDFLICRDEIEFGLSYSNEEYREQFYMYVKKLSNPQV